MTAKKAAPLQAGLLSATKWGHGRVFQNRLDLSHHEERSCHADGIVRGRERFRVRQSFGDRWSGVKCDVKIGRVAVAEAIRGQGFARTLMQEALARCRHDYADYAVTLTGQTYLTPFYESLGFAVTSAPYDDYGLRHVDMILPAGAARHSGTAEGRARKP